MLCVSPVPSQAGSGDVGEPEEEEEEPGVPGDLAPGSQGDRAGSGCLGIAHRHKPTVTLIVSKCSFQKLPSGSSRNFPDGSSG